MWSARWAMATELEEVEGYFASRRKTAVKSYFADGVFGTDPSRRTIKCTSGRRRRCTAACGGVEVPCLLTLYHRDTRVLEKAKELVARKFVLA